MQLVMKINASTKSLVERLCDLRIYAISVLSFIGSVCAPEEATLKVENHAFQCTTAGPYKAIPSKLLQVGSICRLGHDLVSIHSISPAARHWVEACSSTLRRGLERVSAACGHNCAPLLALSPAWEHEFLFLSIAFNTANAFDISLLDRNDTHDVPQNKKQKAAIGLLLDKLHKLDFAGPLAYRASRVSGPISDAQRNLLLTHYNECPRLYDIFLFFWRHATILLLRNHILHDLITRVFMGCLQYGIVVLGFFDAFVFAHHKHRFDSAKAGNFGDCMTGRVRFMTAITLAYAHAYQTMCLALHFPGVPHAFQYK